MDPNIGNTLNLNLNLNLKSELELKKKLEENYCINEIAINSSYFLDSKLAIHRQAQIISNQKYGFFSTNNKD